MDDGRETGQAEPGVLTAVRSCGSCRACCSVLGVRELEKPKWEACAHLCKHGCGIYEARPGSCANYVCGWLGGAYGANNSTRPDHLGVIVDRPAPMGGQVLVREVWRGALAQRRVRELLIEAFRQGFTVVLDPFRGRRLPTGVPLVRP